MRLITDSFRGTESPRTYVRTRIFSTEAYGPLQRNPLETKQYCSNRTIAAQTTTPPTAYYYQREPVQAKNQGKRAPDGSVWQRPFWPFRSCQSAAAVETPLWNEQYFRGREKEVSDSDLNHMITTSKTP